MFNFHISHTKQLRITKTMVLRLIVMLGVISLFADMATTGARSIIGPYFSMLGASAAVVGIVAGFGEFVAYGLRIVFGYLVDRFDHYWSFVLVGYLINLIAVPLLAFAWCWQVAALFIIIERTGKSIRTPSRDAMLSYASQKLGRGKGFGLHKMLDQIGAMLGPLIVAVIFYFQGGYRESFLFLAIPASLVIVVLIIGSVLYPHPKELETKQTFTHDQKITPSFWLCLLGAAFIAAGYADFPLIAFHFERASVLPNIWIPIVYAVALGASAISSLLFGRLYDKNGLFVLIIVDIISSLFAPFVFLGHFRLAFLGMILWGVGQGSQVALMRAFIAGIIPIERRGFAYGIFNAGYGFAWFLGSATMGLLYNVSLMYVVIFSVVAQLAAVPLFLFIKKQ